jgi:cell division protein FtsI (penicillin-binding protein 3)
MSAFVVVGAVVAAVSLRVVRLSALDAPQPERVRLERGLPPACALADREGREIARFAPRFDLELSPRSLWQAHTPRRMAEAIAGVLGGSPSPDELLAAMLPDADPSGWIRVEDWTLGLRQSQRLHEWIEEGAGSGRGRLDGIRLVRASERVFQLEWRPETLLGEEQRRQHGVNQAWRWARRIADGIHAARYEESLGALLVPEAEATRAREEVWKALLPSAFARPVRGIPPDRVLPLREELEAQGVAAWQMRVAYARDRVYPSGEHELFGSWGYPRPEATDPAPRDGLELAGDHLLAQAGLDFLELDPDLYQWIDERPVRGQRANRYLAYADASPTPIVTTTLDLGLQRFLGQELQATLAEHRAAVAMGIVLEVESGAILAIDSAEAYTIQPFAPVYHTFTTGSTFKVVSMAVALEAGVVSPDTRLDVGQGEYRLNYPDGRPSGRIIREAEGALTGTDSAERFFAFSVNAALAQIGLRVDDERFHDTLVRLGYGRPPGSGLGPERSGFLPSTPWSYAYTHASLGFGHEISTTLWRHAEGLATVVRGGVHRPLRLFSGVEQAGRRASFEPANGQRVFGPRTCEIVRDMMRLGAREGTGREVRVAFEDSLAAAFGQPVAEGAFDLGTKTGTAQKVPSELCVHSELAERARWEREGLPATRARLESLRRLEKPHARCYTSSICIFARAPDDERELMVLIVVDEPRGKERFGSRVAGPAAQRVMAEALGLTANGRVPEREVVPGFGATSLALFPSVTPPWGGAR